jgi:hypothetical protein
MYPQAKWRVDMHVMQASIPCILYAWSAAIYYSWTGLERRKLVFLTERSSHRDIQHNLPGIFIGIISVTELSKLLHVLLVVNRNIAFHIWKVTSPCLLQISPRPTWGSASLHVFKYMISLNESWERGWEKSALSSYFIGYPMIEWQLRRKPRGVYRR